MSQYVGGDENIWLTVPKDIVLKEFSLEGSSGNNEITSVSCGSMELNLSAGDTTLNNITADSLDLGASAGELSIINSTVGTFELDASAGNIHTSGLTVKKDCELDFSSGDAVMQASFGGNVSIGSSAGDVDLTILGADKDQFNYDISPSQGRIVVDGVCDLSRNDDDFYQDNKKDQTIEIDGSTGDVQIRFDK